MNKKELVAALSKETGTTHKDSEKHLDAFIEVVTQTLKDKGEVQLTGFAKFTAVFKPERTGRNPATGKPLTIAARTSAKCVMSKTIKIN